MGKVDLHIHSTASDGRFSPAEIVRKAVGLGLTIIAICDHDTVAGVVPAMKAARDFPGLTLIPGVELSTDVPSGEVHILGHFIDPSNRELQVALKKFRESRYERAKKMVGKLDDLGIHVDWQRVRELARGDSIGRPHIAQAMLEKGYIGSLEEAFTKYIGHGQIAYVERAKLFPVEAVQLVIQAGGLPALAHPLTVPDTEAMVGELKAAGLVAIEVYCNSYTAEEIKGLTALADRYNLIAIGGSDYHGLDDNTETMLGGADVPLEAAERLIAYAMGNEQIKAKR